MLETFLEVPISMYFPFSRQSHLNQKVLLLRFVQHLIAPKCTHPRILMILFLNGAYTQPPEERGRLSSDA